MINGLYHQASKTSNSIIHFADENLLIFGASFVFVVLFACVVFGSIRK